MMFQGSIHLDMWFLIPTICIGEVGCGCCDESAGFAIGLEFLCFGATLVFIDHHDVTP